LASTWPIEGPHYTDLIRERDDAGAIDDAQLAFQLMRSVGAGMAMKGEADGEGAGKKDVQKGFWQFK
jgi:hypothetical protein